MWKVTYRVIIKFPIELIAFFLADTAPAVAGMNIPFEKDETDTTPIQSGDVQLPSGHVIKDVPFCYKL
jgi:hypothetical protein